MLACLMRTLTISYQHERAELLKAVKEMKEEITTLKQDRSRAQEDARRFDDHNRNFPMTSDRGRDHVCERSPSPKGRSGYPSRSKPPGQEYRDRHDNRPRRRRPDDEEPEAAHMTRLTSRPPSQREASRSTNPRQRREAFRSTNPRQRVYPDDDDFGHRARTTQHDNGRIELFPEKIAVKAEEEQQPPGPRFKETFKRRVAGDGLGDRGRIVNKEYTIHDDNGSRSSHKGFGELARQGEQSDR
ncbi:hypothetical protein AC578_4439 [Pseudocercospora eumusae]|uniref:Uncharacterized protein n=1 Tax=Pseudocercospora eumusae TaxID=321146 RepID=A0A139HF75_9PEZI|nr:hypothetical protein AC578_4439 [Pseudocercospora eumusae]